MAVYRPVRERIAQIPERLGPPPWRTSALCGLGWSPSQVQRSVERGGLRRVARGLVAPSADEVATIHVVRELLRPLRPSAAASHATAGELHRLWVPSRRDDLVHATIAGQAERTDPPLRVHGSRLSRQFVTDVDGVAVTTIARTAMDMGRGRRLPDALLALDGAARALVALRVPDSARALRGRTVPSGVLEEVEAELREAYAEVWSWPGTRVLSAALDLLDPRSESPFESWSRAWLVESPVPPFEVSGEIRGASGRRYFGDFVWRRQRLVGEADGLEKYGLTPEEQRRALREQRRREDDLMADGWRFVRWTTGERSRTVTARVLTALAQAARVTA